MSKFNDRLDSLLQNLDPAHKITLNEKGLMIIKLHDNDKATKWLISNGIMPQIKSYHGVNNTGKYGVDFRNSGPADPLFITLGIIPKNSNSNVKINCCKLDAQTLSNIVFKNNDSSGFLFNGSYFYLPVHTENNMYGIDGRKDIYGRAPQSSQPIPPSTLDINKTTFHYKPIGYFHYDMNSMNKNKNNNDYNKTYDGYSLEKNKILTLSAISDTLGFAIFNNAKHEFNIVKYSNYNDKSQKNNVIMGNLLVYNEEIVMDEKKMSVAILLLDVPEKNLLMYDKIYLCDEHYAELKGDQINNLPFDSDVHFKSYINPKIRGKIVYNAKNLYMPYCSHFLQSAYPSNFAGKIPPGYPNHASDLNPRTCILKDHNDNIIVINVEGRNKVCGGIGIDLFDLAALCKGLGAKYALNLDGGGSSKLIWKEKNNIMDFVGLDKYLISNAIQVI